MLTYIKAVLLFEIEISSMIWYGLFPKNNALWRFKKLYLEFALRKQLLDEKDDVIDAKILQNYNILTE